MNNEPVAWMYEKPNGASKLSFVKEKMLWEDMTETPLYTHPVKEQDEPNWKEMYWQMHELNHKHWAELKTHPVKELNDGGEPVKNATYWKRQYNLMATQNDNLKSGLYHANEQIKYLESHPVEEQDESFDRTASHMAGEYVSWTSCVACGQRVTGDSIHTCSPQLKEQDTDCQYCKQGCIRCDARKQLTDEEISQVYKEVSEPFGEKRLYEIHDFARAILRKASEK